MESERSSFHDSMLTETSSGAHRQLEMEEVLGKSSSCAAAAAPSKRQRRSKRRNRPNVHSPPAIPIILAALLSAAALQPAGDGGKGALSCLGGRGLSSNWLACQEQDLTIHNQSSLEPDTCSAWDEIFEGEEPAFSAEFLTLVVRTAFIFLEFGSRPLKNAKKILSCGLICLWLYHYRFGNSIFTSSKRIPRMKMLDGSIAAENATFVVSFLILRLAIKMADLLKLFKTWKRLRIVKLLKLAKLAKLFKWVMLGKLSMHSLVKILRYFKLLKLLKVSRKTKKLLNKRHYKSFKIFKAFKVIKLLRLALVVFCIEGVLSPVWAWPWGGGICPHI